MCIYHVHKCPSHLGMQFSSTRARAHCLSNTWSSKWLKMRKARQDWHKKWSFVFFIVKTLPVFPWSCIVQLSITPHYVHVTLPAMTTGFCVRCIPSVCPSTCNFSALKLNPSAILATLQHALYVSMIHFNISLGNMKFFVQSNPSLLVCDCDSTGLVPATTCQSFGGQCMCLPGVRGRQCDECSPGHYSFSATGCSGEWHLCPSHTRIN